MENQNFTEGKIVKQLITFVFPIMFAMLLQSLYGAVDLLIVGHFSNAENLSGVTIGSMVMQTVTFVICDLAIGTTILLGQFIGQGEKEKCGDVIGAFGVRVPLSMLFSSIEPVSIFRIALATPSSTFVQILLCLVYLAVFMRKRKGAEFARKAQ